eukprot:4547262-Amphidinium_carterae.1
MLHSSTQHVPMWPRSLKEQSTLDMVRITLKSRLDNTCTSFASVGTAIILASWLTAKSLMSSPALANPVGGVLSITWLDPRKSKERSRESHATNTPRSGLVSSMNAHAPKPAAKSPEASGMIARTDLRFRKSHMRKDPS